MGYIEAPVQCGEWKTNKANFSVLKTGPRVCRFLGANIKPSLGLAQIQKPNMIATMNTEPETNPNGESNCNIKNWAQNKYPGLFSRPGKINNHVVQTKTTLKQNNKKDEKIH